MNSSQVFQILQAVGGAMAETFGPSCEVLLHNTANPQKSIIWIQGNVTGREIGGPMTNIGLDALESEAPPEDLVNYAAQTADGRALKSSTIFLRDENDKIFGIFCFNVDVSHYAELKRLLDDFITPSRELGVTKNFSTDLNELLETMIEESFHKFHVTNGTLNRDDRIRLIAHLENRGFFRMRKSVPVLAHRLSVSRFTLYNDLKQVRGDL
jgi:predicted transcriptional regulator YheO